jgi:alpha-glucuronidase
MLAAALKPHGGIVMWRAFVYAHGAQANPKLDDRAKQAYDDFKPLDGQFADNVLVQVKNGAIDFQPREPFHPLFGAMPKTPLMMEFQITKEYLGQSTHLTYLGPLFEETLRSDTGTGGTVADVIKGIAGVANIGTDRNWSGSTFNQADWYAFGRFAWDPQISAKTVAREWAAQTFSPRVVAPVTTMMMGSREAAVDYMTPLGLASCDGHRAPLWPAPWIAIWHARNGTRSITTRPTLRASASTARPAEATPSPNMPRRSPPACPPWPPRRRRNGCGSTMSAGIRNWPRVSCGTPWCITYDGVAYVGQMQATWDSLRPLIEGVCPDADLSAIQHREAQWWRDASIAYFQSVNGRPLPAAAACSHAGMVQITESFPYAPQP